MPFFRVPPLLLCFGHLKFLYSVPCSSLAAWRTTCRSRSLFHFSLPNGQVRIWGVSVESQILPTHSCLSERRRDPVCLQERERKERELFPWCRRELKNVFLTEPRRKKIEKGSWTACRSHPKKFTALSNIQPHGSCWFFDLKTCRIQSEKWK